MLDVWVIVPARARGPPGRHLCGAGFEGTVVVDPRSTHRGLQAVYEAEPTPPDLD
jgi:hypothetical protein